MISRLLVAEVAQLTFSKPLITKTQVEMVNMALLLP